jgi:hypothetical protein
MIVVDNRIVEMIVDDEMIVIAVMVVATKAAMMEVAIKTTCMMMTVLIVVMMETMVGPRCQPTPYVDTTCQICNIHGHPAKECWCATAMTVATMVIVATRG